MMNIVLALIAALLPAIFLWVYIWRKDPQPEPTSWLVKAALLGIFTCVPAALLEWGIEAIFINPETQFTSLIGTTTEAFLAIALPEEALKLLALWLVLRKNPHFNEHFDGIVYAVCVGLGFAALENVLYVLNDDEWFTIAIYRALLSVPGHYAFAVLMGYFYSVYHFVDHSPKIAACILLAPVLAHGAYDALAMSGLVEPTIAEISFVVLIFLCTRMHKMAKAKVLELIEKDEEGNNQQLENS